MSAEYRVILPNKIILISMEALTNYLTYLQVPNTTVYTAARKAGISPTGMEHIVALAPTLNNNTRAFALYIRQQTEDVLFERQHYETSSN